MALKSAGPKGQTVIAVLCAAFLGLWVAPVAHAFDPLDPSFGEGGIAFSDLGGGVNSLVQDAEGRLVSGQSHGGYFLIVRYLSNGSPDLSFGGGDGRATSFLGVDSQVNAVAMQRGKILAAGSGRKPGALIVARYEEGGRRDPSFGNGGQASTFAGLGGPGGAYGIEVLPSGRFLVAGYGIRMGERWKAMLASYRPNGALDERFSSDGILTLRTEGWLPIELRAVHALPNGRILAAGTLYGRLMTLRVLPNGKPDPSFSNDGIAYVDVDRSKKCACAYTADMAVDRRGRVILAANIVGPRWEEPLALLRYLPDGRLDKSFGKRGISRSILGSRLAAKDIGLDHEGRIVVAGVYNVPEKGTPEDGEARIAVVRYLSNGELDRSFADRGFFIRDYGSESVASAVLIQRDGRIVVGGRVDLEPSDSRVVFLMRFLP
jgi:uncharacterized delta-60 repeat protein